MSQDKKKPSSRKKMPGAPIKAPGGNIKGVGPKGPFTGGLTPGVIDPKYGPNPGKSIIGGL
jgi:hypothetical protein